MCGVAGLTDDDAEGVRKWLDENQFERVSEGGGTAAWPGDRQDVWERDGTLVRLTRDPGGQWSCALSRGGRVWLDVDRVASAMGTASTVPSERVAELAGSMSDRVFEALVTALGDGR
jgi:hypothetical protein